MQVDAHTFLARWQQIVDNRDAQGLGQALSDDVSMGAPPYWNRIEGKQVVSHLLGIIAETIEDFTYHRQWVSGNELALEFHGHVDDCQLQGIDLITINDSGLITRLDVMIRPENALATLRERVAPRMLEFFASNTD